MIYRAYIGTIYNYITPYRKKYLFLFQKCALDQYWCELEGWNKLRHKFWVVQEIFRKEDVHILEQALKNGFLEYSKVYVEAAELKAVRREKKSWVTLVNGDERLWLWYIPKNVWSRYL